MAGSLSSLFRDHLLELDRLTARALAAHGFDGLILHAGEALDLFLDDQHYPFKAHPPFKRWAPLLDAPGSLVLVRPGLKPRLIFKVATDFWYQAPRLPAGDWPEQFEVIEVTSEQARRAALPADLSRYAWIGDPLAPLLQWGIGAINPEHLLRHLDFDRAWKTPYEVACLAEANRLGVRGHRAAEACFRAGGSEYDIHQAFLSACGQREQELPYNAIVALNEAGSVLHYQVLRREAPQDLRSLLIDAGASYRGFGSDITRTHARDDRDFAKLIDSMDALQLGLCARSKPGLDWREVHGQAVRDIAGLLQEIGVLRCSVEEALESGAARLFFPHGIGHLLGLQVHDVGGTLADREGHQLPKPPKDPALRLTRVLEPGFVVTMEPGIYFIDALLGPARVGEHAARIDWSEVDRWRPYGGIRIEDNLAITVDGCRNLTREAFATP